MRNGNAQYEVLGVTPKPLDRKAALLHKWKTIWLPDLPAWVEGLSKEEKLMLLEVTREQKERAVAA